MFVQLSTPRVRGGKGKEKEGGKTDKVDDRSEKFHGPVRK